jgi:hypothetical protein
MARALQRIAIASCVRARRRLTADKDGAASLALRIVFDVCIAACACSLISMVLHLALTALTAL